MEKLRMNLQEFYEVFGIPINTTKDLIYYKGLPAYKIGKRWYVDIPEYLKWEKKEHNRNYRYARGDLSELDRAYIRAVGNACVCDFPVLGAKPCILA